MIRLCSDKTILVMKSMRNKEVENLTGITRDQRALRIDAITGPLVRYVAMGITYKIYYGIEKDLYLLLLYMLLNK